MSLKVLSIDDQELVRTGLRKMLEGADLKLVGGAQGGIGIVEFVDKHDPDVILIEIGLPGHEGLRSLAELAKSRPNIPLIVFSAYDHPRQIAQASALGARGFIGKDSSRDELIDAIQRVMRGESLWTGEMMRRLAISPAASMPGQAHEFPFSPRELQLLRLVVKGMTNKQIAEKMDIMPDTVKDHIRRMLRKAGLNSRTQLAVWAAAHGVE